MVEVVKGKLIAEGKTKVLHEALDLPGMVVVGNKTAITAFDNKEFTKHFDSKAWCATVTTCRVFELLKRTNLPVAFERQLSETEFLARSLQMIPLEVVVRRYAVGSYLKRHPELALPEGEVPHSFQPLLAEAFLKTTGGKLLTIDDEEINLGLDAEKGEEDPFILNPHEANWKLFHSKKPEAEEGADLQRTIAASGVIRQPHHMRMMLSQACNAFIVLEQAWDRMGCYLIDYKVEFGYPGLLSDPMLGDVIDNDSWRLRTNTWEELSKQAFRDGEELSEVARKYGVVAQMVSDSLFLKFE